MQRHAALPVGSAQLGPLCIQQRHDAALLPRPRLAGQVEGRGTSVVASAGTCPQRQQHPHSLLLAIQSRNRQRRPGRKQQGAVGR